MDKPLFLVYYSAINPNLALESRIVRSVDRICWEYVGARAKKGIGIFEETDGFPRTRVLEVLLSKPLNETEVSIVWPMLITELGFDVQYANGKDEPETIDPSWIHLLN